MRRVLPYALLAVWTALATVAQAVCVEVLGLGALTPDVPLFLLVAALAQLYRSDPVRMSLVAGLSRATFTVEPPFAVLAGTIAVGLVADLVRRVAELSRPLTRAALVGVASLGFGAWLVFVDAARAGVAGGEVLEASLMLAPTAASSALLALAAWPLASQLPGLRAIQRRAF